MSYNHNDDKPEALLANYTTVRGAELKEIFQVLSNQGGVPESALEKRFARPSSSGGSPNTDHVENCLRFLRALDMVEISAQRVVSRINESVYPDLSFEPRVLHHICQQEGKQSHLAFVLEVMADSDRRRITREILLEEVREADEDMFSLTWNEEKINMWANLFDTLGGLSYVTVTDNNEVITSPSRALLYDLLAWYSGHGEDSNRLVSALNWVDENILPIYSSHAVTPQVSIGVADVLRNMEEDDVVSFQSMTDAENVVKIPYRDGGTEPVLEFSVYERSDQVSYTYPLDREERRVPA